MNGHYIYTWWRLLELKMKLMRFSVLAVVTDASTASLYPSKFRTWASGFDWCLESTCKCIQVLTKNFLTFSQDLYGVCTFDNKSRRILSEYYEASQLMTVEICLSMCRSKGYPFAGLEWQCECHCGYEPEEGFVWAWSDKCDDRCAGDSNQICGGSEAMSVWTTPTEFLNGLCVNDYPEHRRVLDGFSITGLKNLTVETCGVICKGRGLQC